MNEDEVCYCVAPTHLERRQDDKSDETEIVYSHGRGDLIVTLPPLWPYLHIQSGLRPRFET